MTDIRKKLEEFGLTEIAEAAGLDASSAYYSDCLNGYLDETGRMVTFGTGYKGAFDPRITYWPSSDTVIVSQLIGGCIVSVHGASPAALAQLLRLQSLGESAND